MDIEKLEKAFLEFIQDNPSATRTALLRMANEQAAANAEDEEDDNSEGFDPMKHRFAPTLSVSPSKPKVVLGKNKSVVNWNGIKKNSTSVGENDELDWISPAKRKPSSPARPLAAIVSTGHIHAATKKKTLTKESLSMMKDRILKARADKLAVEESYTLVNNRKALEILSRKLHEGALSPKGVQTPAMASIVAHPSAAEGSKPASKTVESPALRLKDDYPVADYMPDEFRKKPRIEKTEDRSFGAMAKRTPAAATLNRPKPEFRDTSNNDQGVISANQPSAKIPTIVPPIANGQSMAASTYKSQPNSQKQQFPRVLPSDAGDAIEDGRGGYTA